MSVSLNISCILFSAAELRDGITKRTEYLMLDGCFGFYRVANSKESRLSVHPETTQCKY